MVFSACTLISKYLSFDRECSAKDSEAVTDVFKAVMTEFERERGYGPSGDDQFGRYLQLIRVLNIWIQSCNAGTYNLIEN